MKDLYSFNLVTLLNCGKIRYLNKDSADPCHFYDVSFFDLKDLQIENVIKAVGLYPIPFFSVKLADRKTHIRKVEAIRNTWFSIHMADFIHKTNHLLTYASKISQPHDLHEKLCLKDEHWSLLHAESGDNVSVVQHAFLRIGGDHILNHLPPPRDENQTLRPVDDLLKSKLPHSIVSALLHISDNDVRNLRKQHIEGVNFIGRSIPQRRLLERHTFSRFTLFVGVNFFKFLCSLGYKPIEAFLKTIEAFESAPTILANRKDEFQFSNNLFHWLNAHGLLPAKNYKHHRVSQAEDFPENLHDYFDFKTLKCIPQIKNLGLFHIPECMDQEHKRLLHAINEAITNNTSLNAVVQRYYEGAFE